MTETNPVDGPPVVGSNGKSWSVFFGLAPREDGMGGVMSKTRSRQSNLSPKTRRAALAFGPLLVGGMLIAGQGFAGAGTPEGDVASASGYLVAQPEPNREEYRELVEAAKSISLPAQDAISEIPDPGIQSAAQALYDALVSFRNAASSDFETLSAAADRVNQAGAGLQQAVQEVVSSDEEGPELGRRNNNVDRTGSSALALTMTQREYRWCLRHTLTGYTLCLATATTNALKAQCNSNFLALTISCTAVA
ncbi:hypothetical protein [Polyangium sp. y55x31]|uniref:hypothetical protein n=1 Tax=Polyangium sp. y55x31 TaxID=3042688 RepID=UPI0024826090|nr:hypothetical protein [Polyangium sp. y55x31]MDI1479188.1 hypothetical protein [Polyangium sp. y55x31]